jgi:tetratricopeptide (TPR) repeat protein
MPAHWAATQNNLGNALRTLGERAGGSAGIDALNQAVAAYRAALEVYTRETMPAHWAATQNNLGAALRTLGERAGGSAGIDALDQALAAFRAALEVFNSMAASHYQQIAQEGLSQAEAVIIKLRG